MQLVIEESGKCFLVIDVYHETNAANRNNIIVLKIHHFSADTFDVFDSLASLTIGLLRCSIHLSGGVDHI